jgi:hypothetical protein
MNRGLDFLTESIRQRDLLGLAVFTLLIAAGVAAVSILFSQTMKEAALKRFHLASDSYSQWAVHQAVPSMYNFENSFKFSNVIDQSGYFDTDEESYLAEAINHFPARFITFGDRRHVFANGRAGMFEMESVFGDTALISRWEITRDQPNELTVNRVDQRFEYRDRGNADLDQRDFERGGRDE